MTMHTALSRRNPSEFVKLCKITGFSESVMHVLCMEACEYVKNQFAIINIPDRAADLSIYEVAELVEAFRRVAMECPSAGVVATHFGNLVLYALGTDVVLNRAQEQLIRSACSVTMRQPIPVIRWAEFVLTNLKDPERIRLDIGVCIRSKIILPARLYEAIKRDRNKLDAPLNLNIFAIGYSEVQASLIKGLTNCSNQVRIFVPEIHRSDRTKSSVDALKEYLTEQQVAATLITISQEEIDSLCGEGYRNSEGNIEKINLAVTGCTVVGRHVERDLIVVNTRPCVEITQVVQQHSIPVVVAAGLYKIWPTFFFERYYDFIQNLVGSDDQPVYSSFSPTDIDFFMSERGLLNTTDFVKDEVPMIYFNIKTFDVSCAHSACTDEQLKSKRIKNELAEIDSRLSEFSLEEQRTVYCRDPHPETLEYWRSQKTPEQLEVAQNYFEAQLGNSTWYQKYEGQSIAIFGEALEDIVVGETIEEVLNKAWDKWGYRPIFAAEVSRTGYENLQSIRLHSPRLRPVK